MIRSILALATFIACASPAAAQTQVAPYPTKAMKVVVGAPSGARNDRVARIVAARVQSRLGQPVIVENIPSPQSIEAASIVAKAPPDGYTLLIATTAALTINPFVYSKLPYDPGKDFAPVSLLAEFPLLLVVDSASPIKSIKELVDYAGTKSGGAKYGVNGVASQLTAELFKQGTGAALEPVSFDAPDALLTALRSGEILMAFAESAIVAESLKTGQVRALGITTPRRAMDFPEIPTLAESGVPNMVINLWTGLVAPAGTPPAILSALQDVIADALDMRIVKDEFDALFVDAWSTSPKEFAEIIARDSARWKEIADKAKVKLD